MALLSPPHKCTKCKVTNLHTIISSVIGEGRLTGGGANLEDLKTEYVIICRNPDCRKETTCSAKIPVEQDAATH